MAGEVYHCYFPSWVFFQVSVLVPSPWQHAEFRSIEVPQIGKLHPYLWTVLFFFFPPFFPFWAVSQAVGSSFMWEPTRGKAAWSLLLFCRQRCFPLKLLTRQVRGYHKGFRLSLDENEHLRRGRKKSWWHFLTLACSKLNIPKKVLSVRERGEVSWSHIRECETKAHATPSDHCRAQNWALLLFYPFPTAMSCCYLGPI